MTLNQKYIAGGIIGLMLIAATAVGATYLTRESMAPDQPVPTQQAQQAPAQRQHVAHRAPCNDHNIIGTVGGAVAGGVIGNQFGKGAGKTIATVGGAGAGGYLGNEYIPTRGATCD